MDAQTNDARRIIDALSQPFDKRLIKHRKIGGRQVDYVGGEAYIARLNQATAEWSFRVTKEEVRILTVMRWSDALRKKEPVEVPCQVVHGELEIPGVGVRSGIGVQLLEDGAGEDVVKGALTDAFKNCCKYFMLGLHMYSDSGPLPYDEGPAAPTDYSDREDWQAANRRLHSVAGKVIGGAHHTAVTLMAQKKGAESVKHLPAEVLNGMADFMEQRTDEFNGWYDRNIKPQMPATGPQQGELN